MENFDWILGFLFPYMNFALFLFLAIKFFRKPMAEMVSNRRADFERMVKEANRAREEAERENRELQARLDKLDAEVTSMKAKAKVEAEHEAEVMVRDAQRLAEHLKTEARRIADTEIKRARESLQTEIIAAVRDNVANKLANELDTSSHLDIVRKRIPMLNEVRTEG